MSATAMIQAVNSEDAGAALARVILEGDLSRLSPEQKVTHYNATCQSLGVNPLTRPLEYIRLNGKEVLYARKDCTDQLRALRKVTVTVVDRVIVDGLCIVTARASMPDGRADEEIGAVPLGNLAGEARANAIMKAMTKAKRRVTLSICGLGFLDETEVADIPSGPRHVPNLDTPREPAPAGSMRAEAEAIAAEPRFPVIAPNGQLAAIRGPKWIEAIGRALGGMENAEALSLWRAEMGAHLASMAEAGHHEMVEEAERLMDLRRDELAEVVA